MTKVALWPASITYWQEVPISEFGPKWKLVEAHDLDLRSDNYTTITLSHGPIRLMKDTDR